MGKVEENGVKGVRIFPTMGEGKAEHSGLKSQNLEAKGYLNSIKEGM